jgi:L-arabinonolactonase
VLGEGLSWCATRQAWLWTDIERSCLWAYRPGDGLTRQFHTPDRVGTFVLTQSGRVILGLAKGLGETALDLDGSDRLEVTMLVPVEADLSMTRINDGRTDRSGAFVFGTYNEAGDGARGSLYQYTRAHGLRRLDVGYVATANSICFSPDGRTMYYTDSSTRRIRRSDYDSARASVTRITTLVELGSQPAVPDGSIIDADGGLWNAEWGSGFVRRYDMSGHVTDEVQLDAPHATCPGFGGPDLSDLCITSARTALSAEQAARHPTAGGLFHVRIPGRKGIPETLFRD